MQYQKNPRSRFGEKVFIGQLNWRWIHIYLKFISRNTEISNSIFPLFISFTFSHSTIKKDFFIKYLFSKCDEIFNGKLHFLYSVYCSKPSHPSQNLSRHQKVPKKRIFFKAIEH